MKRSEILNWLQEDSPRKLQQLWTEADGVRRQTVGEEVHLRGLVEFSNCCARECFYCGLRAANRNIERYRMSAEEILECARDTVRCGFGTIVLQSGEDDSISSEWLADVVRNIKRETPLAVTLSVGERSREEYNMWREAGADRYLLKFETSDSALYEQVHPSRKETRSDRIELLRFLRELGYEIGSGVMVGLPGQTYKILADDIALFAELELDMIGVGPFIPHPDTPLGNYVSEETCDTSSQQVPNSAEMACKVVALTRLICPDINIPSTTALETSSPNEGRVLGLQRGANVIMPNLTPAVYRERYEIYPGKTSSASDSSRMMEELHSFLASIGRVPATGRGDSLHYSLAAAR